jgi:hypothetical protein
VAYDDPDLASLYPQLYGSDEMQDALWKQTNRGRQFEANRKERERQQEQWLRATKLREAKEARENAERTRLLLKCAEPSCNEHHLPNDPYCSEECKFWDMAMKDNVGLQHNSVEAKPK